MRRLGLALGLPGVLFALWWVLSAGSTSFFLPPLRTSWARSAHVALARLANDVLPSLARLPSATSRPCPASGSAW